jgi:hypothetical protein
MADAVKSISFLGQATYLSRTLTVDGTSVGGLSGITYDQAANRFYSISDDRGTPPNEPGQPPRFYTLNLDLSGLTFDASKVSFTSTTRLLKADGTTYAPLSTDTEAIRLTNRGTVYISSEGQVDGAGQIRTTPFINEFNLATGGLVSSLPIPLKFLADSSLGANLTRGARDNLAFESLAITPDNGTLIAATENALFQDGPSGTATNGSRSRILRYDLTTGQPTGEFLYNTDAVAVTPIPATGFATAGLVELTAIDNNGQQLLALERSFSVGVPGTGNSIKLYEIDLGGATNIASTSSLSALSATELGAIRPVQKRLILDLNDLNLSTGLDNVEGITFGPILANGQRSLILVSDDNFNPSTSPQVQTFTQILAFSIDLSGNSPALAQPVTTTLSGNSVQIIGTDGNDSFTGDVGSDRLFGLGGNDSIGGNTGNDLIGGNTGNDLISGDDGDDTLYGGRGNDTITSGNGNDLLFGDLGNDNLNGGSGNDTLIGVSPNNPRFPGINEVDTLTGAVGNDLFILGNTFRAYYDEGTGGLGLADYALITDFSLADDTIQLIRNPNNTGATYEIGASPSGLPSGAGIFIDNDGVAGLSANDELIAVLQGFGAADASAITARFRFV